MVQRFRYYYAQVKWRKAALAVMAFNRLRKSMIRSRKRHEAARVIQALARGFPKRKRFRALKKGATTGQRVFRGGIGRRKAAIRRKEVIAEVSRCSPSQD